MSEALNRLVLPIAHRFFPTVGPGGLVNFGLSKAIDADASHVVHVIKQLDVMEVLERDDDFSVRLYDGKMTATTGPFFLGMNDPLRYTKDAEVIWQAVRREDVALVRRIAREESQRAIDAVRGRGAVDVVRDVAQVVPARVVCRYYGTPVADPGELRALYAETSKFLFAFWSHPGMKDEAIAAAGKVKALLSGIVSARRASGTFGDGDVLGRFLELDARGIRFHDGDAGIVRSIAGLQSGHLNAPNGLFVYSIDKLLGLDDERRDALLEAARAASQGDGQARAAVEDHWYEAERFSVYPPFSYRYAEESTVLARGTSREKPIPKGSTVVTWQSLAAFDPEVFADPFEFVAGRPRWQYLGFGHARHRCLGEGIGQIMLKEMAEALLSLPGLRRAPGKAGTVQSLPIRQGKYPSSFGLEFDR